MPLSAREGQDVLTEISYETAPDAVIAVATDRGFRLRELYEDALRVLEPTPRWHLAETRVEALGLIKETHSHLVYFYCHGGARGSVPFLHVGGERERPITADWLAANDLHWEVPRRSYSSMAAARPRSRRKTPAAVTYFRAWLDRWLGDT